MRIWNAHTLQMLDVEKFAVVVSRIMHGEEFYRQKDGYIINKQHKRRLI